MPKPVHMLVAVIHVFFHVCFFHFSFVFLVFFHFLTVILTCTVVTYVNCVRLTHINTRTAELNFGYADGQGGLL